MSKFTLRQKIGGEAFEIVGLETENKQFSTARYRIRWRTGKAMNTEDVVSHVEIFEKVPEPGVVYSPWRIHEEGDYWVVRDVRGETVAKLPPPLPGTVEYQHLAYMAQLIQLVPALLSCFTSLFERLEAVDPHKPVTSDASDAAKLYRTLKMMVLE